MTNASDLSKACIIDYYIDLAKPRSGVPHLFFPLYILMSENTLIEVVKKVSNFSTDSPVLAPLSVTQRSALAERGSRDSCLSMPPLNQSERIRAQDVDFIRLKIYLWRVRLATVGKLFKFSSRLTWRIGMSVACLHFH